MTFVSTDVLSDGSVCVCALKDAVHLQLKCVSPHQVSFDSGVKVTGTVCNALHDAHKTLMERHCHSSTMLAFVFCQWQATVKRCSSTFHCKVIEFKYTLPYTGQTVREIVMEKQSV